MLYIVSESGRALVSTGAVIGGAAAFLAIIIAFYVLRGIGLYKLAVRYGVKYPILAWFPFTWFYVAGALVGNVAVFGKRFDKFALTAFIVFTVSGVIYNGVRIVSYIPVIGYFLQGGETLFATSTNYLSGAVFDMGWGYVGLVDFIDNYSDAMWKILNVLSYISTWLNIVSLFFTIIVFSNFFRSFLPHHYFVATLFSVLFSYIGLFGVWAFVVRNNERVNYAEYMRARYAAFYGAGRGYGDGNGGYGGGYGPRHGDADKDDPFGNMDADNKDKNGESDDPFSEFDDRK